MGMYGDPPPAPDYNAAAKAQGAANVETAITQGHINNPTQITPYGTQTTTWNGNDPTITQTLSPDEQSKLDLSNRAQIGSLEALNKYGVPAVTNALSSPYSLPGQAQTSLNNKYAYDGFGRPALLQVDASEDGAPNLQTDIDIDRGGVPGSAQSIRDRVTTALMDREKAQLDPRYQQEGAALESQLANQGITRGSQAYQTEMDNFARNKDNAYQDAANRAIAGGGDEATRDYGMDANSHQMRVADNQAAGAFHNQARDSVENLRLTQQQVRNAAVMSGYQIASQDAALANSGRAQNLQELVTAKTLPINVLDTILNGGKVNNPTFNPYSGSNISPPPLYQAANDQANYGISAFNADSARTGQFLSAAGSLGSAWLTGPKPSDRRLKSNIKHIGYRNGHKWYSYEIFGRQDEGVMADEVGHVPGATSIHPSGYMMVDYSKLGV